MTVSGVVACCVSYLAACFVLGNRGTLFERTRHVPVLESSSALLRFSTISLMDEMVPFLCLN